MSDFTWNSRTGADSGTQYDGAGQYDTAASGSVFWSMFFGSPWLSTKTDWTGQEYYNFADLDRVEWDTGYLANMLLLNLTTVTNRDRTRFEFFDSMNRIEGNIKALADNFYAPTGWEPPKLDWRSGVKFDWRDARRLEKNLQLIFDLLNNTILDYKYCGTFACGEDVI